MATLLHHEQLRVTELSQIFNNTTTSYKFYWFWALLEHAQEKETIWFRDLLIRMVSLSWHTVVYYKLEFGGGDQLPEIMKRMLAISDLNELSKQEEIEDYLHICWSAKDNSEEEKELIKAVKKLEKEVPYRSLRPFVTGAYSKKRIIDTAQRYFGVAEKAPIYKINSKLSSTGNSLTVQSEWRIYLQQHYKILQEFCWWNLAEFLRRRNPSVPSVGAKIGSPHNQKPNTANANKFWKVVLQPELPPLYCLYTQQPLQAQWSIDHFVPWSFVLHDQLWNLSPQPNSLNSSKNNRLPHRQYWEPFAQLQYQAVQRFIQQKPQNLKLLEEYDLLYKTSVGQLTRKQFTQELLNTIEPLMQQAQNLGFAGGWDYNHLG
ncbi:MAG: HNH endonuclease domain-containing protein [Aureispira sp.]